MVTVHRGWECLRRRLLGAWVPWVHAAGQRKHEWATEVARTYESRVGTLDDGTLAARTHLLEVVAVKALPHTVHGTDQASSGRGVVRCIGILCSDRKWAKSMESFAEYARQRGVRAIRITPGAYETLDDLPKVDVLVHKMHRPWDAEEVTWLELARTKLARNAGAAVPLVDRIDAYDVSADRAEWCVVRLCPGVHWSLD